MTRTTPFDLEPGRIIARKYEVVSRLGGGWEGEVYRVRERNNDIERAAKLFYPERNIRNKTANAYARKLHALRECPVIIQYHFQEVITLRRLPVTVLISEFVEGELVEEYVARQPGKRVPLFQGIHLLHALATGIESIHAAGEYHGDLHSENIIVRRLGLSFELKFVDMFHWGKNNRANRNEDIVNAIRMFYDAIGGAARYRHHPDEIRRICCGLKRSIILKRFRTATALRRHIETQQWSG
jgi:tRNA A-37 threonylcarbamoyl transferase component Bud32